VVPGSGSIGGCSTAGESTDAGAERGHRARPGRDALAGATLIEPITPPDTKSINDDELTVLFSEFKVDIEAYLAGLRDTSLRTLGDLIAFNDEHCERRVAISGQELFHVADATTGLDDPAYREARVRTAWPATRTNGIDRILAADRLDAIVGPPTVIRARPRSRAIPRSPSRPGRPTTAVPGACGCRRASSGKPALLGFAFDLESELGGRPRPTFAGTLPDLPARRGHLCDPGRRPRSNPARRPAGRRLGHSTRAGAYHRGTAEEGP
jgi:hypothetical protein